MSVVVVLSVNIIILYCHFTSPVVITTLGSNSTALLMGLITMPRSCSVSKVVSSINHARNNIRVLKHTWIVRRKWMNLYYHGAEDYGLYKQTGAGFTSYITKLVCPSFWLDFHYEGILTVIPSYFKKHYFEPGSLQQ